MLVTIAQTSDLDAAPPTLWQHLSSMRGVNEELRPWLRMSCPERARRQSLAEAPTGQVLFVSTLLLLGLIPYDRHAVRLARVRRNEGFVEESTSLTMRRWRHERTLSRAGGRTRLEDRVTFEPRVRWLARLLRPVVLALFAHRHAVLRRKFGGVAA